MAERTVICAWCNATFTTTHPRKIFCKHQCTMAATNAKHNAERRVIHQPRTCKQCPEVFTPKRSDQIYCSARCGQKANYAYVPTDNTRPCVWCGEIFKPKRSDARYCSRDCFSDSKGRVAPRKPTEKPRMAMQERHCATCGADISHRMGNTKFCAGCYAERPKLVHEANQKAKRPWFTSCLGCGVAFDQPKQRQFCNFNCAGQFNRSKQLAIPHEKTCTGCGETFTTMDKRRNQCGTACRQWVHKYPGVLRVLDRECRWCATPFRANTAAQRYCAERCGAAAGKFRRRGRMEAQFVEEVNKGLVARRDKWRCQLCGDRVNKKLEWPHPMSASLDHVIPVSKGGEHSYANVQLSHLVCNVSKGNRIKQATQLALIG